MESDPAERLVEKIRAFVAEQLDDEERQLFAALIAPGLARAYEDPEVAGFDMIDWESRPLPRALGEALRRANIRVEGLEP